MSRMLCKCGATMGTSVSPSPYSLCIYYEQEIFSALADNPQILLSDFLTDWDELKGLQKKFMKRSEPVEYWYCTECHRVYETQMRIGGHWLRVYQRTECQLSNVSFEGWTRIFVFEEVETDTFLEKFPQLLLFDYIKMHEDILYLLSPDERTVVAVSAADRNVQFTYIQED